MERSYNTIDKSTWPRGEWDNEPDKIQFVDAETKLPCLIVRQSWSGHLCGYVGVPEGHPMYLKQDYDHVDIDVHGGLTFGDTCQHGAEETSVCHIPEEGEPDNIYWLGFDCAHSGDLQPVQLGKYSYEHGSYKNINYVKEQITKLALQLSQIAKADGGIKNEATKF